MARTINRVDLLPQNGLFVDFDQSSVIDGGAIVQDGDKKTRKVPVHDDLANCFLKLIPHLMFSCQFLNPNHTNDEDWFDGLTYLNEDRYKGISVTGVVFVGKDKDEPDGVKLIGRKTTTHGDAVSINSPIIYFDPQHAKSYPLSELLGSHVDNLKAEVIEYLFKKKYAPHFIQGELAIK